MYITFGSRGKSIGQDCTPLLYTGWAGAGDLVAQQRQNGENASSHYTHYAVHRHLQHQGSVRHVCVSEREGAGGAMFPRMAALRTAACRLTHSPHTLLVQLSELAPRRRPDHTGGRRCGRSGVCLRSTPYKETNG